MSGALNIRLAPMLSRDKNAVKGRNRLIRIHPRSGAALASGHRLHSLHGTNMLRAVGFLS